MVVTKVYLPTSLSPWRLALSANDDNKAVNLKAIMAAK